MPIFEYKCAACGLEFEKLVFGDAAVSCPNCKSDIVVKKFSVFGMSGVEKQTSSGCSSCSSGNCSSCR
jgi:putative FmdB family regulatory protein